MFTKNFMWGGGGQFSWRKINPRKCPLELKPYILPGKTPLRKLLQGGRQFSWGLIPGRALFPGAFFLAPTNAYLKLSLHLRIHIKIIP